MKINFEFKNITELEELYDSVCDIPDSIEEDILELGTPLKETWGRRFYRLGGKDFID